MAWCQGAYELAVRMLKEFSELAGRAEPAPDNPPRTLAPIFGRNYEYKPTQKKFQNLIAAKLGHTSNKRSTMTTPSIGRIVHYKLGEYDVSVIAQRRGETQRIYAQHSDQENPRLVSIGNAPSTGDVYPAMIVRTWGTTEESSVQLQVFLDGYDTYWATSRSQGNAEAQYSFPVVQHVSD